jgi:serine/threonine-protein kinase
MEYVEGMTLSALLRKGALAPERARHIGRQIAEALAACHALGVLHRDLKPGNVMVDVVHGDHVKLIDFGLARVPVGRVSRTGSLMPLPMDTHDASTAEEDEVTRRIVMRGVVFGTVTYMPPEIALGMDRIDERSDLYALGVVLYEMLAGRPPHQAEDPAAVLKMKRGLPVAIRRARSEVPLDLERLAFALLAPEPNHRPQSASEVVRAFEAPAGDGANERSKRDLPASTTLRVMPGVMMAAGELVAGSRRSVVMALVGVAAAAAMTLWWMDRQATSAAPLTALVGLDGVVAGLQEKVLAVPEEVAAPPDQPAPQQPAERPVRARGDAAKLRARFLDAHRRGLLDEARRRLMDMVFENPEALAHDETRRRAGAVAALLGFDEGEEGRELFEALRGAGEPGHDVLYEVMSSRGGTAAAEAAGSMLAAMREQLSPALRVAVELRETTCANKPTLFERAGREGDRRARIYLNQLRSARCDPRIGECCFHRHRGLEQAVRDMRAR